MTISLRDYGSQGNGVATVRIWGEGYPGGYCFSRQDIAPVLEIIRLWDLQGEVVGGRWYWDGNGNPVDERGLPLVDVQADSHDALSAYCERVRMQEQNYSESYRG